MIAAAIFTILPVSKLPGCEDGAVDVDESVGQLGANHACEKVTLAESGNDDNEDEDRHPGEEDVVGAKRSTWRCDGGAHDLIRWLRLVAGLRGGGGLRFRLRQVRASRRLLRFCRRL